MLNIEKILLPLDFPHASIPVIHQAATLARHFHSEIVLLHVVTALSLAAGVPADGPARAQWDLFAELLEQMEENAKQSLRQDLEGLTLKSILVDGDPAHVIVETAQRENARLTMMPSHGQTFDKFLLGAVTARVLHRTDCPIWTGAHTEQSPVENYAIRKVLCAVDFGLRTQETVSWATQIAGEFGARLTLAHVTGSVEVWGPGGSYINQEWKDALVNDASRRLAELQQSMGLSADVFIGSGDVPKILSQAAAGTNADLLVTGTYPYGGHLRTHGYSIICAVGIPVLNV